ncbi:MAG: PaaI family thioesterase [Dehalococcoidia bacterium]|nr:PaaI family thioesterase [Dehalococcoidia bacterium]
MTSDSTNADSGDGEQPTFPNSPFGEYMGLRITEVTDEVARATVEIQPHHLNPTGMIHGGVFISLSDNVATTMANRAHQAIDGDERFMVGIDLHASMISNQPGGTITFEARPVRVGRRVAFIRTTVTGDGGRLLAEVTTTHVPA